MGCCGQGRQTLRREPAPASRERPISRPAPTRTPLPEPVARVPPRAAIAGAVWLHYLATSPVRVIGPVTGRRYLFSGKSADQAVDPRDAEVLLATRHFARAGPA